MPLYETDEDLSREDRVKFYLELCWRATLHKLPKERCIDFAATRDNKLFAYIEVKTRTCKHNQWPTYLLSKAKYDAGIALAKQRKVPFILVVSFSDGETAWIDLTRPQNKDGKFPAFEVEHWGRSDRPDDPKAKEPCIVFPMRKFMWMVNNES